MTKLSNSIFLVLLLCCNLSIAQQKRQMDFATLKEWKKTGQTIITNDGKWVSYEVLPVDGNQTLVLYHTEYKTSTIIARGHSPAFSEDGLVFCYRISPHIDTIKNLKRKKTKEENLPKDTLVIQNLLTKRTRTIPEVKSYQVPEKWSGFVFVMLEPREKKDSLTTKLKWKKESIENGSKMLVYNTKEDILDTLPFAKDFAISKKWPKFIYQAFTQDSNATPYVACRLLHPEKKTIILNKAKGQFKHIFISENGDKGGYFYTTDTTNNPIKNFIIIGHDLFLGKEIFKVDSASLKLDPGWRIADRKPMITVNNKRLIFGIAPKPILQDTSLLPEEIVNVEVWTSNDAQIYPQQVVKLNDTKKANITLLYDLEQKIIKRFIARTKDDQILADENESEFGLILDKSEYAVEASWLGFNKTDIYIQSFNSNKRHCIKSGLYGNVSLSEKGKYAIWFDQLDSSWYCHHNATNKIQRLTSPSLSVFHDPDHDMPSPAPPFGLVGWSENDKFVFLYDQWDIWQMDPDGIAKPIRLTNGKDKNTQYRRIKFDKDERHLPLDQPWYLNGTDLNDFSGGIFTINPKSLQIQQIDTGQFDFGRIIIKAKSSSDLLYFKQNYSTCPDWLHSSDFKKGIQISDINPQQKNYLWGTMESISWVNNRGKANKGLMVLPDGFDAKNKYPMIVNFYEKSANAVYSYRPPEPLRSQIPYSYYASNGYIVFNPDIAYTSAFPGEDAYDAVMSGVQHLINQGFVDITNIGIQGHSWGGYQAAYIISKTNLFKAAEAGAPVFNMFSAYGGIRWESGLSRMFQYEHQQSRIGGTPWEFPLKYIQNSPLFSADRINTPVLILHNDKDGAVPWYQGIEMYIALRRLGKSAWLLNYNEEPHWPVKLQNRLDFQLRMAQYFDYYLKGAAMPAWMKDGVPAELKGIRQGYELTTD